MNILIVDDEKEIRDGLSFMIQQLELDDFTPLVIDTACDGNEALDIIMTKEVHMIITDIRMPGMDGLQLLEEMYARHATIQTVVLSGHEDFSKVQQALRLNAVDYLLKPVKTEELIASLRSAYERRKQIIYHTVFCSWDAYRDRDEPYRCVVAGNVDRRAADISHENRFFHSAVAEAIVDLGKGVCSLQYDIPKQDGNYPVLIGFYGSGESEVRSLLQRFANNVISRMSESSDVPVSFGVSDLFHKGTDHEGAYPIQACKGLLRRIFEGTGIWRLSPEALSSTSSKIDFERIFVAWDVADLESVMNGVQHAIDQLLLSRNVGVLQRGVEFILLSLVKRAHEQSEIKEMISAHEISEVMVKLLWSRSAEEYKEVVMKEFGKFLTRLVPANHGGQVLQRAKRYIRENYHRSLSLADVSKTVHVSPNYLSYLFRDEAGMTFLEYLTSLRMQEAKRLLMQPGIKIYEVAEKVGYGSWKHFSRIFKDTTDYNPVDYRKRAVASDELHSEI